MFNEYLNSGVNEYNYTEYIYGYALAVTVNEVYI